MRFWEGMKALQQGEKVRRVGWSLGHYYIMIDSAVKGFDINKGTNYYVEQLPLSIMQYDDWEIYTEPIPNKDNLFNFQKAMELAVNNRTVKYVGWKNKSVYVIWNSPLLEFAKVQFIGGSNTYRPQPIEITGDWEEYKEEIK